MSEVVVVGLASFYLWYLLAEATIFDKPLGWIREHGSPLVMCPFCASFWIVLVVLLIAGDYDPLTHLAATGLAGVVGRYST